MSIEFTTKQVYDISDLVQIIRILRGPDGCPWDREQDHHSIRINFLEEAYEAVEAIDKEDAALLREELGDVLLQVVFHAQLEEEKGVFDFSQVCDDICKKMIERHPHVFGSLKVADTTEVLSNWDQIKKRTKGQKTITETLESVPTVLPMLMRAQKVQHRAAKAGFDYPDLSWALENLESELAELKEAIAQRTQAQIDDELGDLLFSAVNVARFVQSDAEQALSGACSKFIRRFSRVEQLANARSIDLKKADIHTLDQLWCESKQMEDEK